MSHRTNCSQTPTRCRVLRCFGVVPRKHPPDISVVLGCFETVPRLIGNGTRHSLSEENPVYCPCGTRSGRFQWTLLGSHFVRVHTILSRDIDSVTSVVEESTTRRLHFPVRTLERYFNVIGSIGFSTDENTHSKNKMISFIDSTRVNHKTLKKI